MISALIIAIMLSWALLGAAVGAADEVQQGSDGGSITGRVTVPVTKVKKRTLRGSAYRSRLGGGGKESGKRRQTKSAYSDIVVSAHPLSFTASPEGDIVTHQQVGQLLLMRATMGEHVVKVVATHNDIEPLPNALQCLVHLADNLAKDFGLGYLPHERGQYDPAVLRAVNLDESGLEALRVSLGHTVVAEIMEVVDRCT